MRDYTNQVYVSRGHVWYRLEITGKLHGIGGILKLPWNFIEVSRGETNPPFWKVDTFNNLPLLRKRSIKFFTFVKTINSLWEVSQIFFLLSFLALRLMDEQSETKSMDSFHVSCRIIRSTFAVHEIVTTTLWNFIVILFIPLHVSFHLISIFFFFRLITLSRTRLKNRARFITNTLYYFSISIESGWKYFYRKFRGKNTRLISRELFPLSSEQELELLLSVHSYILLSRSEFSFYLPSYTYFVGKDRGKFPSERKQIVRFQRCLNSTNFFFFSKKRTIQKIHWDFHLVKRKYPKNSLSFTCKIISVLSKKIFWKLYSSLNEFEYLFVAWKKRRAAFGKLSSFLYSMLVRWHSNYALGPTRLPEPTPLRRTFSRSFHVFKRGFCNVILIVKGSQVTRVF